MMRVGGLEQCGDFCTLVNYITAKLYRPFMISVRKVVLMITELIDINEVAQGADRNHHHLPNPYPLNDRSPRTLCEASPQVQF